MLKSRSDAEAALAPKTIVAPSAAAPAPPVRKSLRRVTTEFVVGILMATTLCIGRRTVDDVRVNSPWENPQRPILVKIQVIEPAPVHTERMYFPIRAVAAAAAVSAVTLALAIPPAAAVESAPTTASSSQSPGLSAGAIDESDAPTLEGGVDSGSSTSSTAKTAIQTAAKKHASKLGSSTTSVRCTLIKDGCYQKFQKGAVHWTKKTGAHPTYGTIASTWADTKREKGEYGYPTGDPYVSSTGRWAQKFQGGTISTGVIRKGLPHGVKPDGGRQLVLAHTASRSSTRGTVELWALNTSGTWKRDHRFTSARFGYNGLATASGKVEGDGKTPMGQYKIPFAFGTNSKPSGTDIEYRKVDGNDQWCGRSTSPHYNSWMDAPNKSCPAHAAEVLSDYYQYNYAAVIGYNPKRTPKRGSAIFLHTHGKGSTAGCVSVTTAQAKTLLRWMDPEKTPRIVIAPRGELKNQ